MHTGINCEFRIAKVRASDSGEAISLSKKKNCLQLFRVLDVSQNSRPSSVSAGIITIMSDTSYSGVLRSLILLTFNAKQYI
jgi:hypothetical protein